MNIAAQNRREIEQYMTEVCRFPLLSQKEEYDLAVRWRDHGDMQAAHSLVTANLRFVVRLANRYRWEGLALLDVIQEGNIGLMKAVRSFDPDKGMKLVSYAAWWIKNQIQQFIFRVKGITQTESHRRLFRSMSQAEAEARNKGVADVDRDEYIANSLDVTNADVRRVRVALQGEVPLNEKVLSLDEPSVEEELIEEDLRCRRSAELESALAKLDDREKEVIRYRHLDKKTFTQREVGEFLGVSRQRVNQIEKKAVAKLRKSMRGEMLDLSSELRREVGHSIYARRIDLGLTQLEASKEAGIGQTLWSKIEKGSASMGAVRMARVCKVLGVAPAEIVNAA